MPNFRFQASILNSETVVFVMLLKTIMRLILN